MDRFSGHIDHFREFEADSDRAALHLGRGLRSEGPMELWNRDRKLMRWEGSSTAKVGRAQRAAERRPTLG